MAEITYGFSELSEIVENYGVALTKIETFQAGLEGRFDAIKAVWQDEPDKVVERDKNFTTISENLKGAHDEFKQIVDLLSAKNEAFHSTKY